VPVHTDLRAEEESFCADLARVPAEDAITATDGTVFTDRLADWAVSGERGSAVDTLDRRLGESVTDRLTWMLSTSQASVQHWLDKNPEFATMVEFAEPAVVSQWWSDLTAQSDGSSGAWTSGPAAALVALVPAMIGSLNGVPATDRVAANRAAAPQWIQQAKADLADAEPGSARAAFLVDEIAYLERVVSGEGSLLYVYDRDSSRIVEMIGTPTAETETVITYSPGTFTSMRDFYSGGTTQISNYLVQNVPGTVAFVYKDGVFPGENVESGGANMLRITEANDPERALVAGEQLASFAAGMRADPLLVDAEQDAIGFSWGLANVASSEIAGVNYDKVISLSGRDAGRLGTEPGNELLGLLIRGSAAAGPALG